MTEQTPDQTPEQTDTGEMDVPVPEPETHDDEATEASDPGTVEDDSTDVSVDVDTTVSAPQTEGAPDGTDSGADGDVSGADGNE